MFEDAAKALTMLARESPWLLLIVVLALGWWYERKERLSIQNDYKKLDHEVNHALNTILSFMEVIKDRIKR